MKHAKEQEADVGRQLVLEGFNCKVVVLSQSVQGKEHGRHCGANPTKLVKLLYNPFSTTLSFDNTPHSRSESQTSLSCIRRSGVGRVSVRAHFNAASYSVRIVPIEIVESKDEACEHYDEDADEFQNVLKAEKPH